MPGHPRAAHHHRIGAVAVDQVAPDADHPRQRIVAGGGFGDGHVEGAFAGEAVHQAHLPQIPHVAADRTLRHCDDAEAVAARQRRQHAGLRDAEHRPRRRLAADLQAGIGIAGDHEGIGRIVRRHQPAQRHHRAFEVGLRLDAERALRHRDAFDLRAVVEADRPQRLGQIKCHLRIRIRIDDENLLARVHAGLLVRAAVLPESAAHQSVQ